MLSPRNRFEMIEQFALLLMLIGVALLGLNLYFGVATSQEVQEINSLHLQKINTTEYCFVMNDTNYISLNTICEIHTKNSSSENISFIQNKYLNSSLE